MSVVWAVEADAKEGTNISKSDAKVDIYDEHNKY